jgi:hypothetical protein
MHEMGVRVCWAGRRPRLWRSVIRELEVAQELTADNDGMALTMCVNYGGRRPDQQPQTRIWLGPNPPGWHRGARIWTGHGIPAHNLVKIGALAG